MIYCVYTLACLILVVLQSTVFPVLLPPYLRYDLSLSFVVYLSLFHPPVRAFFLLLIPGLMMDAVTGGAMGLYVLAYLWLFVIIRSAIHLIERDSLVVMIVAVVAGVALEHSLFWWSGLLSGNGTPDGINASGLVFGRIITAGLTGPLLLLFFRKLTDFIVPQRKQISFGSDVRQGAG